MKHILLALGVGVLLVAAGLPGTAEARGTIEKACLNANRPATTRALCGCIQQVADATLSSREQRKGAKLFADPDLSQATKISNSRSDVLFWEKWQRFADTAVRHCQ